MHAIAYCRNASRDLSATAEFPVVVTGMSFELLAVSLLPVKAQAAQSRNICFYLLQPPVSTLLGFRLALRS